MIFLLHFWVQYKIVFFILTWVYVTLFFYHHHIYNLCRRSSYNHHLSCCCAMLSLVSVSFSLLFLCLLSTITWFVCLVHGKHLLLFAFILKRILCWGEHFDFFFYLYLSVRIIFSVFYLASYLNRFFLNVILHSCKYTKHWKFLKKHMYRHKCE